MENDLTLLLERARTGDTKAAQQVITLVYDQLRAIARAKMGSLANEHTLQPTALVHEAYMRALGDVTSFENRTHFFFVAARAMHDIMVESARRKATLKRGGDQVRVSTDNLVIAVEAPAEDMIALSAALEQLEARFPRAHKLVMLRFFVGMTNQQAAELLEVTERTMERDWRLAKTFLYKHLDESSLGHG